MKSFGARRTTRSSTRVAAAAQGTGAPGRKAVNTSSPDSYDVPAVGVA